MFRKGDYPEASNAIQKDLLVLFIILNKDCPIPARTEILVETISVVLRKVQKAIRNSQRVITVLRLSMLSNRPI